MSGILKRTAFRLLSAAIFFVCIIWGTASGQETYQYVTKWGSFGTGDGQFWSPFGVAVDASENVYVANTGNTRIQKYTSDGTFITKWGSYGAADGQFDGPHGVAVDSSGNVYVADSGNQRIQKFTSDGTFMTKWGSQGAGDGQFFYPGGVAVDSSGNVYVADSGNQRIQKLTSDGTFITKWGSQGTTNGQFDSPYAVAVDSSGNVYVVDNVNDRIQKFTSDGTFITKWGNQGAGDGQFLNPSGVAVGSSGNVYVVEQGNHRIQKFAPVGAPPPSSQPKIEVSPSYQDFGRSKVNTCSATPQEFTISNTGSANLNVSSILLSDTANFTLALGGGANPCYVENPIIPPDGVCTVAVSFCPQSVGHRFANLTVISDEPAMPSVAVELSGTTSVHGWKRIITIDGMDMWSSLFSSNQSTEYLYKAVPAEWLEMITRVVGPIESFRWSRDIKETEPAVQTLYTRLKELNDRRRPVVILSHSWGTVLAYITLSKHVEEIHVDKLITLGSPLNNMNPVISEGTEYWLDKLGVSPVIKPANVNEWHNYLTLCDPVASAIWALPRRDNYRNMRWYSGDGACHSSYFEDSDKWFKILLDVAR